MIERDMFEELEMIKKKERIHKILRYVMAFFSLLFILFFFIRVGYGFSPGLLGPPVDPFYSGDSYRNGFYYVFDTDIHNFVPIKVAFLSYLVSFIFNVVWLIRKRETSSILSAFTVLFTVGGTIVLYLSDYYQFVVLYPFLIVTILTLILGVVDIIFFPVRHDFLIEKIKVRRYITYGFVLILAFFYLTVMSNVNLENFSETDISGKLLLISWSVYIIVTPFLRQRFFESRKWTSLYLMIPSFLLLVFYYSYAITENDYSVNHMMVFYTLLMLLPALVVNIDLIINSFKEVSLTLLKGRKTDG